MGVVRTSEKCQKMHGGRESEQVKNAPKRHGGRDSEQVKNAKKGMGVAIPNK